MSEQRRRRVDHSGCPPLYQAALLGSKSSDDVAWKGVCLVAIKRVGHTKIRMYHSQNFRNRMKTTNRTTCDPLTPVTPNTRVQKSFFSKHQRYIVQTCAPTSDTSSRSVVLHSPQSSGHATDLSNGHYSKVTYTTDQLTARLLLRHTARVHDVPRDHVVQQLRVRPHVVTSGRPVVATNGSRNTRELPHRRVCRPDRVHAHVGDVVDSVAQQHGCRQQQQQQQQQQHHHHHRTQTHTDTHRHTQTHTVMSKGAMTSNTGSSPICHA